MFHQGDLQSGITAAIQQRKLVTCFVHDDSAASQEWETSYLSSMESVLQEKTILLKIGIGTQEASFLSAFCPVSSAPAIVVIDNGKVIAQIGSEASAESFHEQLSTALGFETRDTSRADVVPSVLPNSSTTAIEAPQTTSTLSTVLSPDSNTPTLQSLLPGRASRLEADHARKQAEEKAARVARAEARRKEIEAAQPDVSAKGKQPAAAKSNDLPSKARTDWIQQQSRRIQEAKAERERILRQIQADRENRKIKDARPKMFSTIETAPSKPITSSPSASCALQVRLVDGSSIKRQFSADDTLKDVRTWIAETAFEDSITKSYTFRQLLIPQPSRSIDSADEHKSLQELGLTPSATLVVSPTHSSTDTSESNLFARLFSMIFGVVASLFAWLASAGKRAVESSGSSAVDAVATSTGRENNTGSARLRTKTLAQTKSEAGQDDKQTEFYNGNSSAFESRKDDDGE